MNTFLTISISAIAYILIFATIAFICDILWKRKILKFEVINTFIFIVFVLSSVLLSFLNNYMYEESLSMLGIPIYYLSLFASVKIFTKTKTSRVLYLCLFIVFVDSLLGSSFVMVFDVINFELLNEKLICGIVSILFNLLCIIILYLCRKRKTLSNFLKSIELIPKSIYVSILIIFFLMGGLTAVQSIETDNFELRLIFSQLFIALIIPALVLIIIIMLTNSVSSKFYENISALLENQVKRQIKYYEQLEEKNTDLRAFKHDYENHIQCIKYTLESESKQEALEYIESLNYLFEETQNKFNTGNFIADALFDEKNIICKKAGISFEHTGVIPMTYIKGVELCILLFNLLDNAIEACMKITEGEKLIRTITDYKNQHLNIMISNTVSETIKIQNNFILSTKEDKSNHGFGLMNIHRIVKKYDGVIKMNCESKLFTIEITFHAPLKDSE